MYMYIIQGHNFCILLRIVVPQGFGHAHEHWQNMAEDVSPLSESSGAVEEPVGRKRLASADSASTEVNAHSQPPVRRRLNTDGPSNWVEYSPHSVVETFTRSNTEANTRWALANFSAWQKRRKERFPDNSEEHVPTELLKSSDSKLLSKWLSLYAAEARKQDGSVYLSKSIYLLLAGLLRHMRSLNPACPNFLSYSNVEFAQLHRSLENTFRELQGSQTVSEPKTSEAFSREEEDRLWSSGALSTENPKGLLRAAFYLNGRNFGLVGGDKHRQLKISQLKRVSHPPRYVYTRCVPENQHVPFTGKKTRPQSICIDAVAEKGTRCHVHVLDLYLQKLPPEALENDVFYVQPEAFFIDPTKSWFTAKPVGLNALGRMVRDICADAGIEGLKTNQSLRASGATNQAGLPVVELHNIVNEPTSTTAIHEPPVQSTSNAVQEPVFVQPLQTTAHILQPQCTINQPPVSVQPLQATTQANTSQPQVVQPQPIANQQPVSMQPTAQANTVQPNIVLQSPCTVNEQPAPLQADPLQGIPQNLTFNNCHVTIIMTPFQQQPEGQ